MKRIFAIILLLTACESLKEEEAIFPQIQGRNEEPPYVVECETERGNAEIDPYAHIWKIKIRFSKSMDKESVEKNILVGEADGLKEGVNNIVNEIIPKEISWDYDGTVMFLTIQLYWGKWFFIKIGKEAKDIYGNFLDGRVSKGSRPDDDFSSSPSDFYSLPFRVGGASTTVPLLKEGIMTPLPGRFTYSPFIEKVKIFHRKEVDGFFRDNSYISLDGMYGKGIILYPDEVSFTIFFKVPSKGKISAPTFSAKILDLSKNKEIPLLFRNESTGEWFEYPDELSDFTSISIKSETLEPSTFYMLKINTDEKLSDEYGIKFVDLQEDEDNLYALYFATSPIPFSSPVPPSLLLFSLSEGVYSFIVPDGGLFHRIDLENLYQKIKTDKLLSYGEELFPSPNAPHTPTLRTVFRGDAIEFSDQISAGDERLDTDGDGISGGRFRKSISSTSIPVLLDPYEPDDTIFQAYPLSLTSSCEENERLLPAWDTDFFSFSLEVTSTVSISNLNGIDIAIRLYDENLKPLKEDIKGEGVSDEIPPGKYYIQVVPQYPPLWNEYNPPFYILKVCNQ